MSIIKTDNPINAPGYIRIGRRYLAIGALTLLLSAVLLAGLVYMTALHPLVMREWYNRQTLPQFYTDSPYLSGYTGRAQLLLRGSDILLYEGMLEKAAANGEGKLFCNGILVYEGFFKENMYEGKGKLYNTSGELRYEGDFSANLFSGLGASYEKDGGLIYYGEFKDGLYDGEGTLYFSNGGASYVCTGAFTAGARNGPGKLYRDGRLIYDGMFKDGMFDGPGKEYGDGLRYDGGFANGLYDGEGRLYDDNRLRYKGGFFAGLYEGEGNLYEGGALLYSGEFSAGVRNGAGTEYDPRTGFPVFEGRYLNGARMEAGTGFDQDGNPEVTPQLWLDPLILLGADYTQAMSALIKTGAAFREQVLGDRLMIINETDETIFSFLYDGKGAPVQLLEIYFCGLSAVEGVIVGADVLDITLPHAGEASAGAAEIFALGVANAYWGRDVRMSEVTGRSYQSGGLLITAYYLTPSTPAPDVESGGEDEVRETGNPELGGRILFLRVSPEKLILISD